MREAEAMNLGDGLKLETQILNGKTKLILAPYDVQEKTSKQVGNKSRARGTALKVKPQPQVLHPVQNNHEKAEQLVLKSRSGKVGVGAGKPPTNVLKELENKKLAPFSQQNAQQSKVDAGKTRPVPKKFSNVPKQRPQHKPAITAGDLRESLVCLTQEQFQQILMTINQSNKPNAQEHTADQDKHETEEQSVRPLLEGKEEDANPGIAERNESPATNRPKDVQAGSLFDTLGEREKDKSLQEAKKAQWKRELDEQVALKKKLKEADQEGINRHREGIESSVSERTPYSDLPKNTPLNDYSTPDSMFKTSPGTETTDFSPIDRASSFSSPELPAAIRSAFVLGEAAPLDHPFSAVKRQQQKKWLDELNKQREEIALRKMQEKQKIQEAEQQDLWAMHFDSFKKAVDNQTPVHQNTATFQLPENVSSPSEPIPEHHQTPAVKNVQHEQPETRMSTEEEYFQSQKAGFLRTMTALLDPAQIEERDRKRQKQLEHQRAIAAQVEEKRKRKQLEEEERQREEQEEERRLAKEQEQLQKQYEEDMFRQKQKEEVLSMKTRELYQSMQKAQEEAQRLKQEQRMRHLLHKGHDVSNLQRSADGEAVPLDPSRAPSCTADIIPEGSRNGANSIMKPSVTAIISPRRDTAVQTDDVDTGIKSESVSNGLSRRREQSSSPDIPVEFTYHPTKAEQQGKKVRSQRDRSESRKENTINDVYDQYARTEKQTREPGRKPDWNRNRPQRKYVPASERYPKGLQKQREESKGRRQMELLHLVEKNSNNLNARKGCSPERSPVREEAKISHPPEEIRPTLEAQKEEKIQKVDPYFKRSDSPPVPAVKNRIHQAQRRSNKTPVPLVYSGNPVSTQANIPPELDQQEAHRPPSSQFVPYVRTKEIYYLDPDAPMSRPSTHDPQYKRTAGEQESRQIFSSDHVRDPLLNPNVVRNKDRQQAILRGLSELRKGLLQKQRELETGLMPDV